MLPICSNREANGSLRDAALIWTPIIAALRNGIGLMNNLEPASALEVAVLGMAIAQVLMIVLTIRRERDVNELRELVEEQRLRLSELRAWLAGRNASQT